MSYEMIASNCTLDRKHEHDNDSFVMHVDSIMHDATNMCKIVAQTYRVLQRTITHDFREAHEIVIVPTYVIVDINGDRVDDVLCNRDLIACDVDDATRRMWDAIAYDNAPMRHANDYDVYFVPTYRGA